MFFLVIEHALLRPEDIVDLQTYENQEEKEEVQLPSIDVEFGVKLEAEEPYENIFLEDSKNIVGGETPKVNFPLEEFYSWAENNSNLMIGGDTASLTSSRTNL
jgi:hypothetical protein